MIYISKKLDNIDKFDNPEPRKMRAIEEIRFARWSRFEIKFARIDQGKTNCYTKVNVNELSEIEFSSNWKWV